ncbi:hypothetical protein DFH09DRAFT_1097273 [Mycena vulgaris]|nr:hypothetical protein DFH09DRAFT_1097273 [Mycena vulgaris]
MLTGEEGSISSMAAASDQNERGRGFAQGWEGEPCQESCRYGVPREIASARVLYLVSQRITSRPRNQADIGAIGMMDCVHRSRSENVIDVAQVAVILSARLMTARSGRDSETRNWRVRKYQKHGISQKATPRRMGAKRPDRRWPECQARLPLSKIRNTSRTGPRERRPITTGASHESSRSRQPHPSSRRPTKSRVPVTQE